MSIMQLQLQCDTNSINHLVFVSAVLSFWAIDWKESEDREQTVKPHQSHLVERFKFYKHAPNDTDTSINWMELYKI